MGLAETIGRHRLAATAAALAIGLCGAELVARIAVAPVAPQPRIDGEILRDSCEPGCGWELWPGANVRLAYPDGTGRQREIVHTIPDHGWRGEPFAPRPAPGVIRIGCVGDSQMFGWGVADEETFPSQLELALRELEPERAFEVLNLGVPNTNAEEKAARVWSTALELGCDCVVMQLFFDDDHLDGVDTGKLGRNAYWLARLRPGGYAPLDFLREHLRSVDVIADHWRRRLGSWSYVRMHEALMRPGHPARERLDAALAHAAGAASERGVELAAIVYPMAVELDGRWASAGIDAQLRDAAGSAGIATLDLSGALAACKGPLTVHPLDHHCSAAAHRAAARATATFLRDSGALERSGRRTSCAQRQAAVAPCASTR